MVKQHLFLCDTFSSNLNEIIKIKDYCFTLVPLGSSFTLAVDGNVSAYSSAGSSFTLTNGGEGDDPVSACVAFYNRQTTNCVTMHSKHFTSTYEDMMHHYKG